MPVFGILPILLAASLAGGPAASARPPCAPPVEAAGVRVIRVEKNGVLVLEDGRAVKLEGLLLPGASNDHSTIALGHQAIAALAGLTVGRTVTLAAQAPKEDRYGRLRAQAFVDETNVWLQSEMLGRGLARVSIAPDRRECAHELYAAESGARATRVGLWAQPAYAVRTADDAAHAQSDTFQIVTGKVLSADVHNGRGYLDFGTDWGRDFTATISPEDLKNFRQAGVDPGSYEGKTVRVRGWLEAARKPEIEVAVPEDIEVLQ